jgi:hypothetical protein
MIFVDVPVSVLENELETLSRQMKNSTDPQAASYIYGKIVALQWVLRGGKMPHERINGDQAYA